MFIKGQWTSPVFFDRAQIEAAFGGDSSGRTFGTEANPKSASILCGAGLPVPALEKKGLRCVDMIVELGRPGVYVQFMREESSGRRQ
jgi:hypothetical protein